MIRKDFILSQARNLLSEFLQPIADRTDRPRKKFLRQTVGAILLSGLPPDDGKKDPARDPNTYRPYRPGKAKSQKDGIPQASTRWILLRSRRLVGRLFAQTSRFRKKAKFVYYRLLDGLHDISRLYPDAFSKVVTEAAENG